ncbi:MAG: hypothetical protein J0L84_00415 [Verrucomicrobia bacterium]|nr:hypothetical protein [Verrucomicrobiota bacterium]
MNEELPIHARSASTALRVAGGDAPEWIMWMPGGTHTIVCKRGTKTVQVTVAVTPETAAVAQRNLDAYRAAGKQRPFFDFDHDESRASAWPQEFAWREDGVWARVEWSADGREAVVGKTYRAFSPAFLTASGSYPGRVDRLPFCMGGLVNDPAFTQIEPFWSANAREDSHPQKKTMDPKEAELAAQRARVTELEEQVATLKAAAESDDRDQTIQAKNAELAEAQRKLDAAENAIKARNKRDAEDCVRAAVARGVIAPQDTALQAHWTGLIESDPKNADLLKGMKGAAPLQASRITRPGAATVQITAEDTNDVLRAYNAERNPRRRGEIYRKELDPILEKGERIPFERLPEPFKAANSLGTLVGNIVSQRTLATLVSARPLLRDVVTDFSDEQARKDQTVYTRAVGLPAVADFGSAAADAAATDYPVVIDQFKQVLFTFSAAEQNSTGRNLVREHSNAMAIAIGNHLVGAVAALITDAFASETVGAAASKDFTAITTACKALNTAGAPDFERFAWVNADFAEALSNDEVLADFSDKANSSAYARWVNVKGFSAITEFPALPANAVQLIGFAAQRNALLLATRTALDPSALVGAGYPGTLQVITDPTTGLSVVNNQWVDAATLAINTRIIVLYGVARGLVGAGHKFVTA